MCIHAGLTSCNLYKSRETHLLSVVTQTWELIKGMVCQVWPKCVVRIVLCSLLPEILHYDYAC